MRIALLVLMTALATPASAEPPPPEAAAPVALDLRIPHLQRQPLLDRAHPGELHITSTPTGATVLLDGVEVGQTPLSLRASAGFHDLRVIDVGRRMAQRSVLVQPGTTLEVQLRTTLIAVPAELSLANAVLGAATAALAIGMGGLQDSSSPATELPGLATGGDLLRCGLRCGDKRATPPLTPAP